MLGQAQTPSASLGPSRPLFPQGPLHRRPPAGRPFPAWTRAASWSSCTAPWEGAEAEGEAAPAERRTPPEPPARGSLLESRWLPQRFGGPAVPFRGERAPRSQPPGTGTQGFPLELLRQPAQARPRAGGPQPGGLGSAPTSPPDGWSPNATRAPGPGRGPRPRSPLQTRRPGQPDSVASVFRDYVLQPGEESP